MGLFDNVKKQVKMAAGSFGSAASATYNGVMVSRQMQEEINSIQRQIKTVQAELDNAYTQIGRKYVEHVQATGEIPEIGVGGLLMDVDAKMTIKEELNAQLIEKQKRLNDQFDMREKAQLEVKFAVEKEKLDRALAMNVLTQSEYDIKLKQMRGHIVHFDEIKRINNQKEMGIITEAERQSKIRVLLNT